MSGSTSALSAAGKAVSVSASTSAHVRLEAAERALEEMKEQLKGAKRALSAGKRVRALSTLLATVREQMAGAGSTAAAASLREEASELEEELAEAQHRMAQQPATPADLQALRARHKLQQQKVHAYRQLAKCSSSSESESESATESDSDSDQGLPSGERITLSFSGSSNSGSSTDSDGPTARRRAAARRRPRATPRQPPPLPTPTSPVTFPIRHPPPSSAPTAAAAAAATGSGTGAGEVGGGPRQLHRGSKRALPADSAASDQAWWSGTPLYRKHSLRAQGEVEGHDTLRSVVAVGPQAKTGGSPSGTRPHFALALSKAGHVHLLRARAKEAGAAATATLDVAATVPHVTAFRRQASGGCRARPLTTCAATVPAWHATSWLRSGSLAVFAGLDHAHALKPGDIPRVTQPAGLAGADPVVPGQGVLVHVGDGAGTAGQGVEGRWSVAGSGPAHIHLSRVTSAERQAGLGLPASARVSALGTTLHTKDITCAAFAAGGSNQPLTLVTGCADKSIVLWPGISQAWQGARGAREPTLLNGKGKVTPGSNHTAAIRSMACLGPGSHLATSGADGRLILWDIAAQGQVFNMPLCKGKHALALAAYTVQGSGRSKRRRGEAHVREARPWPALPTPPHLGATTGARAKAAAGEASATSRISAVVPHPRHPQWVLATMTPQSVVRHFLVDTRCMQPVLALHVPRLHDGTNSERTSPVWLSDPATGGSSDSLDTLFLAGSVDGHMHIFDLRAPAQLFHGDTVRSTPPVYSPSVRPKGNASGLTTCVPLATAVQPGRGTASAWVLAAGTGGHTALHSLLLTQS